MPRSSTLHDRAARPRVVIDLEKVRHANCGLGRFCRYLAEGNNPDQPGRLVQWLYPQTPVMTWSVPGIWYDIGSKETLEEANRIFGRR